jgi:hypothetical protein
MVCIDVTFEMRTVLYGIHLLIDNMKLLDRVFISKQDCGEESRIAKRQREREAANCGKGEMASVVK